MANNWCVSFNLIQVITFELIGPLGVKDHKNWLFPSLPKLILGE